MSPASGPENMTSGSQREELPGVGDITMNMLPAASNLEPMAMATQPERNAETTCQDNISATRNVTEKGKNRRCASSGTPRSESLIVIVLSRRTIKMAAEAIVTRSGTKVKTVSPAEATADKVSKGNNGSGENVSKWVTKS